MAIRNIREYGDEVLKKTCKEVKEMTPRTKELIEDMLETMYDANGVGLAAPVDSLMSARKIRPAILLRYIPLTANPRHTPDNL